MTTKKAQNNKAMKERLDRLVREINELKTILVLQSRPSPRKSAEIWADLMDASEELSARWTGPSVVEEIREQRGG